MDPDQIPDTIDNEDVDFHDTGFQGDFQFRYVDPACSGIAYYTDTDQTDTHIQPTCKNCGSALGTVIPENFIPLTENEKEQLEAL